MKIAYLITAHNQPGHLHRLVEALGTEDSSFYIHVDGKSDLKLFKDYEYSSHVHFNEGRLTVYHGGFSLTRAIVSLIYTALSDTETQYFITLSGWDYPIKDNRFIHEFLEKNYPTNFISFYPLVGQVDWVNNIRKYHFIDEIGSAPIGLHKPLKAVQLLMRKLPFNRPFIQGMIPYRGSAFFCLNRETMEYIADFLQTEAGKKYFDYFKWTSCADELFFHTLVLNSPYARQCRFYERDIKNIKKPMKNENKANLHYIDWDPNRENPAQFTLYDFDKLISSDDLFARKFNEIKSQKVLDAIDQTILKRTGIATQVHITGHDDDNRRLELLADQPAGEVRTNE